MKYRLFNKLNSSVFNLIGSAEPSQTKGLGYILARSSLAMQGFLDVIALNNPLSFPTRSIKKLMKCKWVVDCEERLIKSQVDSKRTDIVIRFYEGFKPFLSILIEAKGIGINVSGQNAAKQAASYWSTFPSLLEFQNKGYIVTLTKYRSWPKINASSNYPTILMLRWQDVQERLLEISAMKRVVTIEKELIEDYIYYLNRIKGAMKFYNKEVLVIPANRTYSIIQKVFFYECIAGSRQYDARAYGHPLFIAFKVNGKISCLYKIKEIVKADLMDSSAVSYLTRTYPYISPGLEDYIRNLYEEYNMLPLEKQKKNINPHHERWVFVLDNQDFIPITPFKTRYSRNHEYYSLREVLSP